MNPKVISDTLTENIRVKAVAQYIVDESNPENGQYVFVYRIQIINEGARWAKLLTRHWLIINAEGDEKEVDGEGVVGYFPELEPGQMFEYTSWCPLNTEWGTMEGVYHFVTENEEPFEVKIGRFYLTTTSTEQQLETL